MILFFLITTIFFQSMNNLAA